MKLIHLFHKNHLVRITSDQQLDVNIGFVGVSFLADELDNIPMDTLIEAIEHQTNEDRDSVLNFGIENEIEYILGDDENYNLSRLQIFQEWKKSGSLKSRILLL